MSDKRPGLPDWWKWVPHSDWLTPPGACEVVVRDGEWAAVAYKDGSCEVFFRGHYTVFQSANYASFDEAKGACERVYLALVGVVGKGGG